MQAIAAAFVKAKRSFGPALKDKTNPAFRSKYADLGACIDAVEEALLANGIAFIQETSEDATGVTVETVFVHESGETLRCGKLHVPAAKQDPQGYGSALTYARRYSLMASCGIAPEDDDGNAGTRAAQEQRAAARANWLADWLAAIDAAANVGDLKKVMEQCIAQAKHEKDADAEGQFLAAQATKIAKAKKAEKA
jgi:hypothetical protein